jgi:hypothetical protein
MSNHFLTKNKIEIDNLDMFPELNVNCLQTNETNTFNFKDVLNTKIIESDKNVSDIILPGWAKLSRKQNVFIYEYEGTKEMMKIKAKEVKEEETINLNEVMDQTIFKMQCKWYQYEYIYDQIHGEGAYIDKFVLPPIYGEEYETDTETEEENSDYVYSDDDTIYNEYDMFD